MNGYLVSLLMGLAVGVALGFEGTLAAMCWTGAVAGSRRTSPTLS